MFGLGPDREILRIHLQRRLFLAGTHPARPRHPRRLRPAQVGDRKALRKGTPDAPRHGDDGLSMATLSPRRHCERSEAIQNVSAEAVWIASSHQRKIATQFCRAL